MKTEVLKSIKKTEEEYQAMISAAQAERKKNLYDAEMEAENLILKATTDAEEYKKQRLAAARGQAQQKYTEIVKKGEQSAETLKAEGSKKLDTAVDYIVSRFKEQLNVTA
ncbi:ATPase [Methanoculleus taiwanensis]|uniref:ATPase n=1 Tax=Methanoculleus taiwanensis TaxID=1550565 RepID=A0A498H247_9EURY|nr:V-type ATPase subunit subunit G family protein [Methanoculleus taiwanensis]RXE56952.1 ATPase [Methanoculleus taiwanensis]